MTIMIDPCTLILMYDTYALKPSRDLVLIFAAVVFDDDTCSGVGLIGDIEEEIPNLPFLSETLQAQTRDNDDE